MVQVLICNDCAKKAEKTNHVDLYGTPTSLLYGCKHAIEDVRRQVEEDVRQARASKRPAWKRKALEVTEFSKVEFKDGKLMVKGRRVPASTLKPPEDFTGW